MPRLHRAKTVAWGLLKWGRCAWMVCVHSVTRGWQDILFLLGCMGYMATHTTPAGRHVLPLCIAGRNIIDSKTYPRKESRPWLLTIVRRTCYTWLQHNRAQELVT